MDRRLLDYTPVLEAFGSSEFERDAARAPASREAPFGETAEFSLAAELLSVTTEAELEHFLSDLTARAGASPRSVASRALINILKKAAQPVLLPIRQTGLQGPPSDPLPAPSLITNAGELFGLELEGLSPEDKEFALARQFVRLAGDAARQASRLQGEPQAVAATALQAAARRHAPGIAARFGGAPAKQGRWIRRAGRLEVLDL